MIARKPAPPAGEKGLLLRRMPRPILTLLSLLLVLSTSRLVLAFSLSKPTPSSARPVRISKAEWPGNPLRMLFRRAGSPGEGAIGAIQDPRFAERESPLAPPALSPDEPFLRFPERPSYLRAYQTSKSYGALSPPQL